jgi:hypothetical protein
MSSSAGGSSLALHTDGRKSSDDRPSCLENPCPAGAELHQRRTLLLHFTLNHDRRTTRIVATDEIKAKIREIGINKCARESGFDRKNFIRKLVRDIPVKRNSYAEFERWLQSYKLQNDGQLAIKKRSRSPVS